MNIKVKFLYITGLPQDLFVSATLLGSWDQGGYYSEQWLVQPMEKFSWHDGCPAFRATVSLKPEQQGQFFHWGVQLDTGRTQGHWGITMEISAAASTECFRSFVIRDETALEQIYYLNHSRCLGAQKYFHQNVAVPGIQFSVWAPNAQAVEVCVATLWQNGQDPGQASLIDPVALPALRSVDRRIICGGYIADGADSQAEGGCFGSWQPFAMFRDASGIWRTDPDNPNLTRFDQFDHLPYMFRITKDSGRVAYRTDIYSRCQIGFGRERPNGPYFGLTSTLDGSVGCSVVVDPDRVTAKFSESLWPETTWLTQTEFFAELRPNPLLQGLNLRNLVIYELHVGALGFDARAEDQPGTLEDALALLDYLVDLGVNAVELLPLSQFSGAAGGWGYATSHYFAIEYSGGGRDQYKWFVRECHQRGIAVILDVVYNHYSHDAERAQWLYDTDAHEKNIYYWYEGLPQDYPDFDQTVGAERRGHGGYLDNLSSGWAPRYWEEMVRSLFISSALSLAIEFEIDGFRMDQTTSIRSYNRLHSDGSVVDTANVFGGKLLRELTRTLRLVKPNIWLMAEDHENWDGVTRSPDQGGLGFDAIWFADFYHHLVGDTDKGSDYAKLIKTAGLGDDRPLAMDYFARALQSTEGGTKVVYHESHDEAGNGSFTARTIQVAANGAPLIGDTRRYAEARCRFAAGVTILSAGVPMFLFGEEVGCEKPFLYNHVLENREDLHGLRSGDGRYLFYYYSQLIRLRRQNPGFCSPNIEVLFVHNTDRLIVFSRWGGDEEFLVIASLNNHPFNNPSYTFQAQRILGGRWKEIFNSDAASFGGDNIGNAGTELLLSPGILSCIVPANGLIVLQRMS